ncbi:hypothetical protein EDB19DRAFT_1606490, partial [Suillus lakei]
KVAPAAIWALDYCLTLEHEVRLFSNMDRWSITTALFIVARYVPIAWIISEIYGESHYFFLGEHVLSAFRIYNEKLQNLRASGLLLIRTLALWHNNKKIKRLLLASSLVAAISMTACSIAAGFLLESACVPVSTQSDLDVATRLERLIMGIFVSEAFFELMVAIVTVYHSILSRSDGMYTRKLTSTLSKGNLLYALSLLAISIANIVSFSLPVRSGQSGIIDVFQGVLHGVIASRILFDLRDAD